MKTKIILTLILFCTFYPVANSQWQGYNLPSEVLLLRDINFLDINTGFALVSWTASPARLKVIKTTNAGRSWVQEWDISIHSYLQGSLTVVQNGSSYTGYVSFDDKGSMLKPNNVVEETLNGLTTLFNKVKFINPTTGYLLNSSHIQGGGVKVYKTTDAGSNWTHLITFGQNYYRGELFDIDISNNGQLTVCGYLQSSSIPSSRGTFVATTSNDFATYNAFEGSNIHISFDHVDYLPNNEIRLLSRKGIHINFNNIIYNTNNLNTDNLELGLEFYDNSSGYMVLNNGKILKTTNAGYNWNVEFDNLPESNLSPAGDLYTYGDITYYYSKTDEKIYIRRLLQSLITYKENSIFNGTITYDGIEYQTTTSDYFRGGYATILASSSINGDIESFYKWDNGNMNIQIERNVVSNGEIAAYYKTKQLSTIPTAINNPNQTKAIRDKNGIVHQIHQSMGGIFYTRSTDNGAAWKKEEIVNYEANSYNAEDNIDPVLSEVFSEHVPALDGNKNVTAVWNRREGNNEVIKFAYRKTINGTDYFWQRDNSYDITIPAATQYYPSAKTFTRILDVNDPHNYYVLTAYLKKESGTTHLKVYSRPSLNGTVVEHNIESGNIEEFSVACKHNSNTQILYFIYKKDGQYYYESFSFNLWNNSIAMTQVDSNFNISAGDAVQTRIGADISLRNGLPVITYRGYVPALRIINYEDNQTQQIPLNYYPIVVRYKTTAAGNPWSAFSKYNSSGFNTQENPNVEGSKDYAAHLINYSVNNAQFRQHVKIDNLTGYYCNPGTFTGTDAKLIRGSYKGQLGANSYPSLLTLQPESGNYRVGKQTFTITNQVQPISQTDSYSNLSGVVEMQNVEYAFNLGPIITREQQEIDGLPQSVTNAQEFVDNLVSDVFKLSEGDTLIVGANPSYISAEDGVFQTINFDVNLVNNTSGQVDRLLFRDSVELIDSVESEYLRGFVITSLREPDSFYVQIDIDQEDLNNGDYYFNGEYQGNNDDNIASPKIIFEISTPELPIEYSISQNYPNPFNPVTNIKYDLPQKGIVSLIVYDITGKQVAQLVNGYKQAGSHTVSFYGSALSSGVYFYKIQAGDFTAVKRMVLVK